MTLETLLASLIQAYGPTGVLVAVSLLAARSLLPLLTQAVAHLSRMADATQNLSMQLQELGIIVRKVDSELGDVQEDIAGLYAMQTAQRPSRRPKPKPAPATGD